MKDRRRLSDQGEYLRQQLHYWIGKLLRDPAMRSYKKGELKQDLYLHYLTYQDRYCPDLSSPRTYIARLMRCKSLNLLRNAKRRRRKMAKLQRENRVTRPLSYEASDQFDLEAENLRIDLGKAEKQLSQRSLWLLSQFKLQPDLGLISKAQGIPIKKLQTDLRRLRSELTKLGIKQYLTRKI